MIQFTNCGVQMYLDDAVDLGECSACGAKVAMDCAGMGDELESDIQFDGLLDTLLDIEAAGCLEGDEDE